MASYRGLNVQKAMNDVDNKAQSLINLGLDQRDLALISGIAADGITTNELHTLAGLVVDQKKSLYSLGESAETLEGILTGLQDIQVSQEYNIQYDDQVRASAIKYNYLDFAKTVASLNSRAQTYQHHEYLLGQLLAQQYYTAVRLKSLAHRSSYLL